MLSLAASAKTKITHVMLLTQLIIPYFTNMFITCITSPKMDISIAFLQTVHKSYLQIELLKNADYTSKCGGIHKITSSKASLHSQKT
jgi:hypothetical protein